MGTSWTPRPPNPLNTYNQNHPSSPPQNPPPPARAVTVRNFLTLSSYTSPAPRPCSSSAVPVDSIPVPQGISDSHVQHAVDAALAAISGASSSVALKTVATEHTGDKSPLAHLNAQLRDVPPEKKAALGKLVGGARGRVAQALKNR